MGNRAVITDKEGKIGVYLHWNGGRDSVEGFLEYCKRKGCRGFGEDTGYAIARFSQVVGNFFGGTSSIGVTTHCGDCDDNGVYVVQGWDIVERFFGKWNPETEEYEKTEFPKYREQLEYDLLDVMDAVDLKQPEKERLGDLLRAELVPTASLKLGDIIYVYHLSDIPKKYEIIGFGEDKIVNGTTIKGLPMINAYCGGSPTNPNNYIYSDEVYRV